MKAVCRLQLKVAIVAVTKAGPMPLAELTIKFAAVRVAPLDSGGFTLMSAGRPLTEGKLPIKPDRNTKRQGNIPAVSYDASRTHNSGNVPKNVEMLMNIGM